MKYISAILLGVIFLVSSSGFLIYKSHCACTGDEQVSMFVKQEICESMEDTDDILETEIACCSVEENEDNLKIESSCCSVEEKVECKAHTTDCECGKPEITYVKLTNQVLNEEVKFTKVESVHMLVVYSLLQHNLWKDSSLIETADLYVDPPPIINSSLDFLIQIQQLKIPNLA